MKLPANVAATQRTWPVRSLKVLLPIVGVLLVVQYIAGLWTNAYAPANGFTSNSAFPSLNLHYLVGDLLGVLTLIAAVISVFTRQLRVIALSVVLVGAVWFAGFAGMAFVSSSPNNGIYSVAMGSAFLVAFWAGLMLMAMTMMQRQPGPTGTSPSSVASGG
jgi:hypothetical protein